MAKIQYNIYIEKDIIDLLKLKQKRTDDFIPSQFIEQFLRDYFGEELNSDNLQTEKLEAERYELEKKLTLIKTQQEALKKMKEDETNRKYKERGFGIPVPITPE